MFYLHKVNKNSLGFKLLIRILLFSSTVSLFLTGLQLYKDYSNSVGFVNSRLLEVEHLSLNSLGHSVWDFNYEQIDAQLVGLVRIPSIAFAEVSNEFSERQSAGSIDNVKNPVVKNYNIYHTRSGKRVKVGQLKVVASLDAAYQDLREKFLLVLFSQMTKTFLVSLFTLFIFNQLIGRHLVGISKFAKNLKLENIDQKYQLDRAKSEGQNDELDQIVRAFSDMQEQVQADLKRRELEQEFLARTEEKMDAVHSSLPALIFQFHEEEGKIHFDYVSESSERLFHIPAFKILNHSVPLLSYVKTQHLDNIKDYFAKSKQELEAWSYEFDCKIENKEYYLKVIVKPQLSSKNTLNWTGILLDISEQKAIDNKRISLEKQLFQAQKLESLGNLSAGIAHDFNNILQGIMNSLVLAKDESGQNLHVKKYLDSAMSFSERGRDLIRKILLFTRRDDSEMKELAIDEVLNDAIGMLKATLASNINIKVDKEDKNFVLKADRTQLHQVILNLGLNAAHAMKNKGGELRIKLSEFNNDDLRELKLSKGNYLCLQVIDNGCGMSEDVLRHIFEPFFTTKPVGEGTGLGMSVAFGIVERHKGTIKIDSIENIGTKIYVYLPLSKNTSVLKANKAEVSLVNNKYKILFLDDEKEILELMAVSLQRRSYEVQSFSHPEDALKHLNRHTNDYDIIVTDYMMPGMNGFQFAQKLKEMGVKAPILLMTGLVEADENFSQVFVDNIKKPFFPKDLLEKINEIMEKNKKNIDVVHSS